MENQSQLVNMCMEVATKDRATVDRWRRQRRSLERMPSHLADSLLRRLHRRRLLYPSLLELFKHSVEEIELNGENSVDAEWMAYLGAFNCLRSLSVADCHRVTSSAIWDLAGMAALKELNLSRCMRVTDDGIRHILSIATLEKLYLSETGLTAEGVALLSSLAELSVLDLGGLPVTDQALDSLKALQKIHYLDLWGSKISNKGAAILSSFPTLSFLNLAWTDVTSCANLPHLECLNMSNCTINSICKPGDGQALKKLVVSGTTFPSEFETFSYIDTKLLTYLDLSKSSVQSFGFLSRMEKLEYLDLSSTVMGDESIEAVTHIGANLRNLNLSHTKISSTGVEILAGHVHNLETFMLSHTMVDDAAISFIIMMPSLNLVDLSNTNIKGLIHLGGAEDGCVPSLSQLQCLSHLKTLNLEQTRLRDTEVEPLSCLQELTELFLRSTSLTDSTLHHLASLPNLTNLGICDAVLTNLGLETFEPPQTLRKLDLRGCWLLSEDDISLFCQNHPQIEVRHELIHILATDGTGSVRPSPSPSRSKLAPVTSLANQQGETPVSSFFVDQRLKYSREELLALRNDNNS